MLGFLQQLRQLISRPTDAAPDASFGLLDSLNIKPMLAQRQWAQLEAAAASLAPEDLTQLLDGLCLTTTYAEALAKYQQSDQSELRRLVAGVHATFIAWQIRGGAYAKYLGEEQIAGFLQHLEQAYTLLNQPLTTVAYQAEAAARLVRVGMGLSEPDMAREAFVHCTELIPAHLQGHLFFFNFLTPKWHGDEEQLAHFVDATAAPALRPLLQAMYLAELYFTVADGTAIVQQQLRNQVAPRLDKLLQQSAPLPDGSLYAIYFNNYLACLGHLTNRPQLRDAFLRVLGSHITPHPWAYFGLTTSAVQKLVR